MIHYKHILVSILASLTILVVASLQGCKTMPPVETLTSAQAKVERANEARMTLWEALQEDRAAFTTREWEMAQQLQEQAMSLAAQVEVALSLGVMPEIDDVQEWDLTGKEVYQEAATLIQGRLPDLSIQSRTAWAILDARLKVLGKASQSYVDNPDAATYQALATTGILLGKVVLGAATGLVIP
jgi:hypothetical protein